MNKLFCYKLEIIDLDGIKQGKFGGDIICNTKVECFTTLNEVWQFVGGKLPRQRCGYSGIKGNKEYRLMRRF